MFESVSHERAQTPGTIVRFLFSEEEPAVIWDPEILESVKRKEFQAELGQIVESFPTTGVRSLVAGLGKRSDLNATSFKKAAAIVARTLSQTRASTAYIEFGDLDPSGGYGQIMGEALGLLSWRFEDYKGSGTKKPELSFLKVCALEESSDRGMSDGLALAESVNYARTLVWTPPNVATPAWIAGQAEALGRIGLSIRVIRGSELEKEQLQGLIHVGRGSINQPCLIRVEYRPSQPSHEQPVVFVGKTITFDTGGLAIKTREGMKGMKVDKAGGCAVLGAMHAIATQIKPKFPVVALLVAAENSISQDAFRMDDVITFRNGVTVEVTNTDAEGRLVLADGLCWACEVEDPRCVIDVATLTGGVVVALGSVYAGLFSNDDDLAGQLFDSGSASGEKVWRLPLHADYTATMRSDIADFVNSAPSKGAHPIQGASFLSQFVKPGVSWAHVDIAGTARTDKDSGEFVSGPTGFGVRLLTRFVSNL